MITEPIALVTALLQAYKALAATRERMARGSRIYSVEGFVGGFPSEDEEDNTTATLLFVQKMEGAAGLDPP